MYDVCTEYIPSKPGEAKLVHSSHHRSLIRPESLLRSPSVFFYVRRTPYRYNIFRTEHGNSFVCNPGLSAASNRLGSPTCRVTSSALPLARCCRAVDRTVHVVHVLLRRPMRLHSCRISLVAWHPTNLHTAIDLCGSIEALGSRSASLLPVKHLMDTRL